MLFTLSDEFNYNYLLVVLLPNFQMLTSVDLVTDLIRSKVAVERNLMENEKIFRNHVSDLEGKSH